MNDIEKYQAGEEVLMGLVMGLTGRVPEDRQDNPPQEVGSIEEAADMIHEIYTQHSSSKG